jgi:hypothetical protein
MRDVEHAGEVDRDDILPVLDHGLGRTKHAAPPRDAGVVDEDRDRSDRVGDLLCHGGAGGAVGDIERKTVGGAARIENVLRGLVSCLFIDVEQHDPRALARKAERNRAPDAGAGASDDRDVGGQEGHGGGSSDLDLQFVGGLAERNPALTHDKEAGCAFG